MNHSSLALSYLGEILHAILTSFFLLFCRDQPMGVSIAILDFWRFFDSTQFVAQLAQLSVPVDNFLGGFSSGNGWSLFQVRFLV